MGAWTDQQLQPAPDNRASAMQNVLSPSTIDTAQTAGAVPRSPHVLVCISGTISDLRLMHQGWLLARRLQAQLTVLYVLSSAANGRPSEALTGVRLFATSLHAALVELPAFSVVDGIAEYATSRQATHLVLSESYHTPWYGFRRASVLEELLPRLKEIDIYVLANNPEQYEVGLVPASPE